MRGKVLDSDTSTTNVSFIQSIPTFFEELKHHRDLIIKTQDAPLNHMLSGGLRPALYFLAGQPGAGKTTWVTQLCRHVAENQIPTLLLEFEMSHKELYVNIISDITGYDSSDIENIDPDTPRGAEMLDEIEKASWWMYENLGCMSIIECDPNTDTVYRIRSHIHRWRQQVRRMTGNAGEKRFLTVIDSTQHVTTGNPAIDKDEVRMESWVGSELARMSRPSDTNSAIIGIAEITKESMKEMIKTGHVDLATLRGSFRMAHSAHVVGVMKTGYVKGGKDHVDLLFEDQPEVISKIKFDYPISNGAMQAYVAFGIVKNRSGRTGDVLYMHDKPQHRLTAIDLSTYYYPDSPHIIPPKEEDNPLESGEVY